MNEIGALARLAKKIGQNAIKISQLDERVRMFTRSPDARLHASCRACGTENASFPKLPNGLVGAA
jgi:hypothetical protein